MTALIVLIILVVLGVIAVGMYNGLIGNKNQVDKAFASIDVLLKKRYDLIPNLIATVQNYMQYESSTLVELTRLRARAVSGEASPDEQVDINNQISKVMGGILVSVENYPELKANQNFMQLQSAITETEEQISADRRFYNAAVTDYNNAVEMLPTSIFASMMNYRTKKLFEAAEQERQNVNVKDLFNR